MSDFKFSCPYCQQHLEADDSMIGTQIPCPTCSGNLIAPEPVQSQPESTSSVDAVGASCPYCRSEILSTERTRVCPSCQTPHHAECWQENKGCTVFGCSMAPPDEDKIAVAVPSEGSPRRQSPGAPAQVPTYRPKTNAPGASSSLVWGILGFFIGGIIFGGIIFGGIAISNANKAKKLIQEQPDVYTGDGLATAGLVVGIVDLVAWGLYILANIANA